MSSNPVLPGDNELAISDFGPLSWVLEELRKSLDGATKALRRFVRDAELARGSDLTELDASNLRIARQQLHQAVGALEMVGLEAPAKVLRAMEALAQKYVQRPELCSNEAAALLERASNALIEYLEGVLKGKTVSSVALFPQYRAIQELVGKEERVHPADLWPPQWRWLEVPAGQSAKPLKYELSLRSSMDSSVLKIVKSSDSKNAYRLRDMCAGLAASQEVLQARTFWTLAAAFFEAVGLKLCPMDGYSKRAASRILQQYASLAKGGTDISERLAQELAFFCSLAMPDEKMHAPTLESVRSVYGLARSKAINYEAEVFGRFDPNLLITARKRIATAAETWSALAGGDINRLKLVSDQFAAVSDSILKLNPECAQLSQALTEAIDSTVRSGAAPQPAVAMEVATSILYLEAVYEDFDSSDNQMAQRGERLAQRLKNVQTGAQPEPMEQWMEDLYRRVSDRQTMGSVVDELRSSLGEVEKLLDQFFRNPSDKSVLHDVPPQLSQMRGVFSVLGLDQASIAALRMRSSVEQLLIDDIDVESARTGIFEKLGNSLGALSLLIDMLSYQRTLAKTMFVWDEDQGEFKPLMGRERSQAPQLDAFTKTQPLNVSLANSQTAQTQAGAAPVHATASVAVPADEEIDDVELLDIFLEEAREVNHNGLSAITALETDHSNLADHTTLRRAFHTLKGSSRMVGLHDFGEAAWAFEQLHNSWLADQKPASEELLKLSRSAMQAFTHWVDDIANKTETNWSSQPFRKSADALRLHNTYSALELPSSQTAATEDHVDTQLLDASDSQSFPATNFLENFEVEKHADAPAHAPALSYEEIRVAGLDFGHTVPFSPEPEKEKAAQARSSYEPTVWSGLGEAVEQEHDHTTVPPEEEVFESTAIGGLHESTEDRAFKSTAISELQDESGDHAFENTAMSGLHEASRSQVEESQFDQALESDATTAAPFEHSAAPAIDSDDGLKVIGNLRLSIPLYNVYLNEADEWSRRLQTELSEWALELHQRVPATSSQLAHSLAGSSGTVGFASLSELARALEHAIDHVHLHARGTPEVAKEFNNAADEIRRLLHQFAAGFLKEANPEILDALHEITSMEFANSSLAGLSQDLAVDPVHEKEHLAFSETVPAMVTETVHETVSEPELKPESEPEPKPAAETVAQAAAAAAAMSTPVAAPLHVVSDKAEDIDAVDSLDADLFPIFEEEAQELLPQLGSALRQWVNYPDDMNERDKARRVLHTLKGSARLAGAMRLGEMSHRMESDIDALGTENLQTVQLEPLLTRFDSLQSAFGALAAGPGLEDLPAHKDLMESTLVQGMGISVAPMRSAAPMPAPAAAVPVRQASGQVVRVRSQLLDHMVNQVGEVMITRSRMDSRLNQLRGSLDELTGNLDRLRQQLRDVELQAETQMQSRLAQTKDVAQSFDPLEFDRFTRVQELTRMMAESVSDVATVQRSLQRSVEGVEDDLVAQGRQGRELQRDLLRTRMIEFEAVSERLYGVVRQASKDSGKQVKLDIVGGSIEMDRGVLERMTPAFEHLLRNAVGHGVEEASVRQAAGKTAVGNITITVSQEANDVSVAFSDDGAGLHLDKIRERAIAMGTIDPNAAFTEDDAAHCIFTPGFSTADKVTELSGRGIGMDVVRSELNALGGRVELSTKVNEGTTFRLVLPLTTAVTQVVLLRMGEFTIGVPSNLMETVLRVTAAQLDQAYTSNTFTYAGEVVPFFWAGSLLQVSSRSTEISGRSLPVAVFRSAGQRLVMHVDEVLGNREVVVKNLGPQLARLPGLAGMSVLASGAVVLIYNPVALAVVYGEQARLYSSRTHWKTDAGSSDAETSGAPVHNEGAPATEQAALIMVVDDSITVRRVTQRLLKREGYRVSLANDGLQALELLQHEPPAVVLTDIEMPRMDGFDLARNIRADAKLKDLPIIMITSRIAEKHREHAQELGVDHYLGKPYSEDELLGLIRFYCAHKEMAGQ